MLLKKPGGGKARVFMTFVLFLLCINFNFVPCLAFVFGFSVFTPQCKVLSGLLSLSLNFNSNSLTASAALFIVNKTLFGSLEIVQFGLWPMHRCKNKRYTLKSNLFAIILCNLRAHSQASLRSSVLYSWRLCWGLFSDLTDEVQSGCLLIKLYWLPLWAPATLWDKIQMFHCFLFSPVLRCSH